MTDARGALAKEHFDLAILIVRLGDGDGVELLGEIRAKEDTSARMPVMMLSSEAEVRRCEDRRRRGRARRRARVLRRRQRRRLRHGSGIGLATVRRIIVRHGERV